MAASCISTQEPHQCAPTISRLCQDDRGVPWYREELGVLDRGGRGRSRCPYNRWTTHIFVRKCYTLKDVHNPWTHSSVEVKTMNSIPFTHYICVHVLLTPCFVLSTNKSKWFNIHCIPGIIHCRYSPLNFDLNLMTELLCTSTCTFSLHRKTFQA